MVEIRASGRSPLYALLLLCMIQKTEAEKHQVEQLSINLDQIERAESEAPAEELQVKQLLVDISD